MNKRELIVGDVVQIRDNYSKDGVFDCALMIVTEPKSWGAQGAIHGLKKGHNAYLRVKFEDMEYVGPASWIPK